MTIGSLFIALGFKITGKSDFADAERSLNRMAGTGTKLTIAVNAINWAMLAMVEAAMKSAQAMRIFEQTTGKSADDLQRWGQAAKVAGLGADALKQAVSKLNDARAAFMLGKPENVGAWSILGANPTEDPFVVLERLRSKVAAVKDPNIMRALLGEVGMEGVMPLLQMTNSEFAEFKKNLTVNSADIEKLVRLNKEWQRFLNALDDVAKTKLAAVITPALTRLAKLFTGIARIVVDFTVWLNSGTTAANVFKGALNVIAVGMLALGAVLAIATAAFAALGVAMAIAASGLFAIVAPLVIPLLAVFALTAGIAGLILLWQDFWTAIDGGKSLFDWSTEIAMVDWLAARITNFISVWDKMKNSIKRGISEMGMGESETFIPNSSRGGSVNQNSVVNVQVDGAQSPEATGRAVAKSVNEVADTFFDSAVYSR
jgi:hypothetical protein